jgi:hypothetical protein
MKDTTMVMVMVMDTNMVMDRAQSNRELATMSLRGRTGGPTLRVGGAKPGAKRR